MKRLLKAVSEKITSFIHAVSARASSSPRFRTILFVLAALLFVIFNIFAYSWGRQMARNYALKHPPTLPAPTPTPRILRGSGKITFTLSSGKKDGPQFQQGYIDPVDPEPGEQQTLGIWIRDNSPITSVQVTMNMDHNSIPIEMKQIEKKGEAVLFQGTWTVNDSYLYQYTTHWQATSDKGTNSFLSTWR